MNRASHNQSPSVAEIETTLGPILAAHPELQCCYVYGSAAEGRLNAASDVDLAVAGASPLSAAQKVALRDECATVLRRDVDVIDLLQATGTLLRNALRGVCICSRAGKARYQVLRRLVYDQEDLQPLRRRLMEQRKRRFIHGS